MTLNRRQFGLFIAGASTLAQTPTGIQALEKSAPNAQLPIWISEMALAWKDASSYAQQNFFCGLAKAVERPVTINIPQWESASVLYVPKQTIEVFRRVEAGCWGPCSDYDDSRKETIGPSVAVQLRGISQAFVPVHLTLYDAHQNFYDNSELDLGGPDSDGSKTKKKVTKTALDGKVDLIVTSATIPQHMRGSSLHRFIHPANKDAGSDLDMYRANSFVLKPTELLGSHARSYQQLYDRVLTAYK